MKKYVALVTFFVLPFLVSANETEVLGEEKLPNIVWIVSEDNSIHYLNHFFPGGAATPNIEGMARAGLTFDHAYSNAPVCSVARTTLATMCYGPRIGTQYHRRYKLASMPAGLKMFPAYLRSAGYYTTNNSKKDYNAVEGPGVWDESSRKASWRNRKRADQPFFHMESHAQSHEGSLHFSRSVFEKEATNADPAKIKLADYFPDTKLFRYTHARYHDRIQVIDGIVGNTLEKLRDDGVLEDTFVFYFGDHGGVLPRSKGYAYDSGLHVPLVVRVPENFKHLSIAANGQRVAGSVEFVDFGATVLHLAGIPLPDGIDGRPFLGNEIKLDEVNSRHESFGYADRFDEKYDLVRSLKVGKYHYLRSYQPYLPDGLQNIYRYKMLAYKQWEEFYRDGKLSGAAKLFFQPKPAEMLFNVESDPHEVNNLAGDPGFADVVKRMRKRLNERLLEMPDLSFFPESKLVAEAMENPVGYGQKNKQRISRLLQIADLQVQPFSTARNHIKTALNSSDPMERYWGLMVCTSFGEEAKECTEKAKELLNDQEGVVQLRAAEFLGRIGAIDPREHLIPMVNKTKDSVLAVEALNSIVWFKDFFGDRYPVKRSQFNTLVKGGDVDDRLNYINGVPYPAQKKSGPVQQKSGAKSKQQKLRKSKAP